MNSPPGYELIFLTYNSIIQIARSCLLIPSAQSIVHILDLSFSGANSWEGSVLTAPSVLLGLSSSDLRRYFHLDKDQQDHYVDNNVNVFFIKMTQTLAGHNPLVISVTLNVKSPNISSFLL